MPELLRQMPYAVVYIVDLGRVDCGIIYWIKHVLLVVEWGISGWEEGYKSFLTFI